MSELTRDEIVSAVHPVDDATVAEIIATGATEADLAAACRFVARENKAHETREVPTGVVGDVISIIERVGARPVGGSPLGEAGSTME
ncbi:hypothetical protein [Rhodoplanes roseus]|uniref:Uncharacterized protein n=1 Tax=Rhodoplanes roseus TaxID=29409 RepID=A0A327KUK2_9BRAD|nr:hypothetical protein [Rhodoplanes roseus]RAI41951.1 hypothetical protein CH341_20650 [Rhodoplanes roseus]